MEDGNIVRRRFGCDWEIPINFKVEEIYHGTNDTDDPSHATVSEKVCVAADVLNTEGFEPPILWKEGEAIYLTDEERREFEEQAFQEDCDRREEAYFEAMWRE